jgi:hypothetical protein
MKKERKQLMLQKDKARLEEGKVSFPLNHIPQGKYSTFKLAVAAVLYKIEAHNHH